MRACGRERERGDARTRFIGGPSRFKVRRAVGRRRVEKPKDGRAFVRIDQIEVLEAKLRACVGGERGEARESSTAAAVVAVRRAP